MLNVNNFDLDFDDDFSSNIFGKCLVPDLNKNGNISDEIRIKCNQTSSTDFERTPSVENQIIGSDNKHDSQNEKLKSQDISYDKLLNFHSKEESSIDLSNKIVSQKRPSMQEGEHKKRRITHERSVQRKFPGPAGLLPDKPFKEIKNFSMIIDTSSMEKDASEDKNEPVIYSQSSASAFLEPAYQKLVSDFDLNESNNPLSKYTVEWVKKTTLNKALQGRKIPFLAVVLHYINHSTLDPVLLLRDPTGEINGTLHRDVWATMGGKLKAGIALALRQVGVLITGVIRRQIYLNITINNILGLYSPSEDGTEVEVKIINKVSRAELLKSLEDWKAQVTLNRAKKNSPSLFSETEDPETYLLPRPEGLFTSLPKWEAKEFENESQNIGEFKQEGPSSSNKIGDRQNHAEEDLSDLGIVFSENDFSDVINLPDNNPVTRNEERNDTITKLKSECNGPLKDDLFCEAVTSINSQNNKESKSNGTPVTGSHTLSQAESSIFQEVFTDINLDEFEI